MPLYVVLRFKCLCDCSVNFSLEAPGEQDFVRLFFPVSLVLSPGPGVKAVLEKSLLQD